MKSVKEGLAICLALFAVVVIVGHCAACSPAPKPTPADAAKTTYLGEHLACVEKYRTDPEIDACREEVRKRWGKPRDAGADQ